MGVVVQPAYQATLQGERNAHRPQPLLDPLKVGGRLRAEEIGHPGCRLDHRLIVIALRIQYPERIFLQRDP